MNLVTVSGNALSNGITLEYRTQIGTSDEVLEIIANDKAVKLSTPSKKIRKGQLVWKLSSVVDGNDMRFGRGRGVAF